MGIFGLKRSPKGPPQASTDGVKAINGESRPHTGLTDEAPGLTSTLRDRLLSADANGERIIHGRKMMKRAEIALSVACLQMSKDTNVEVPEQRARRHVCTTHSPLASSPLRRPR